MTRYKMTWASKREHDIERSVSLILENPESDTPEPLVEMFKSFLIACGYHPDTVKEYLGD